MTEFTIHAIPVAQPRQRHRIVTSGVRSFVQNYTSRTHPANAFKAAVQIEASQHFTAPLNGPVMLWATFICPRPAGKTKKRGLNPRYWHAKKPDLDNLIKSLKDALTSIAWHDDSQVCWENSQKYVAAADELSRVIVRIEPATAASKEPMTT